MNFYLDKLDNMDILIDDQLSNFFLKYFVNDYGGFTYYSPKHIAKKSKMEG